MNLRSVLIANRGEVAVRIIRAAHDLGMRTIAVYAEPDADALHTELADEAYALPGSAARDTYLNAELLLEIAHRSGAQSVHPGYGFLSENADFARAVQEAGRVWVGPPAESIELLGDKLRARALAAQVGAPLAPGTAEPAQNWHEARDFAAVHGLPLVIKAAHGGGGRGLRMVHEDSELEEAFAAAQRESLAAFGRDECYIEKLLERPRHIEVQMLADTHGRIAVLGTRDCSLQRRSQKLIEEAPAPGLTAELEERLHTAAEAICRAADYVGAGTVEFLLAADGTLSFLEVNTRLQVEHPVTEAVTGVDIVQEQLRIAAGLPLSFTAVPEVRGHAVEFRINAEDPALGFVPAPGAVTRADLPGGPGVRVDSGVRTGSVVPAQYDSLLAKLIVSGPSRSAAMRRARLALREMRIEGVRTVLPFHRAVLEHPDFVEEFAVHTGWIEEERLSEALADPAGEGHDPSVPEAPEQYPARTRLSIEIDGRRHELVLPAELLHGSGAAAPDISGGEQAARPEAGGALEEGWEPGMEHGSAASSGGGTAVRCAFDGVLVRWSVEDGAAVSAGDEIAVVEAMKMETHVLAPRSGVVRIEEIGPGSPLHSEQRIAWIERSAG